MVRQVPILKIKWFFSRMRNDITIKRVTVTEFAHQRADAINHASLIRAEDKADGPAVLMCGGDNETFRPLQSFGCPLNAGYLFQRLWCAKVNELCLG